MHLKYYQFVESWHSQCQAYQKRISAFLIFIRYFCHEDSFVRIVMVALPKPRYLLQLPGKWKIDTSGSCGLECSHILFTHMIFELNFTCQVGQLFNFGSDVKALSSFYQKNVLFPVYALCKLFNIDEDSSELARRGSGSACRSVFGGFVQWHMGNRQDGRDSVASVIKEANHWPDMRVLILVVNSLLYNFRSSTASRDGFNFIDFICMIKNSYDAMFLSLLGMRRAKKSSQFRRNEVERGNELVNSSSSRKRRPRQDRKDEKG